MVTLNEIKTILAETVDPESLLDLLGVTNEDLVERFGDRIEEDFERFRLLVEGEPEEEDSEQE